METLIAEDLLLLLLDDETGAQRASSSIDAALGGAVLVELAGRGLVELRPVESAWRRGDDVVVAPGAHSEDPVLRDALATVGEKPRSAKKLITPLGKGLRDRLIARLAERGIIRRQEDKALGLFPRTRWPAVDRQHEVEVRQRIGDALIRDRRPDQASAALIALLLALDELRAIDYEGRSRREVKRRAKQIAEGDWASEALSKIVQEATAATIAVIAATATAGGDGGGGGS